MGIFGEVKDYFGDMVNNWRNKRAAEKRAYQEAYMEAKVELLKEKGKMDARVHVFGKDSVNYQPPKMKDESYR